MAEPRIKGEKKKGEKDAALGWECGAGRLSWALHWWEVQMMLRIHVACGSRTLASWEVVVVGGAPT